MDADFDERSILRVEGDGAFKPIKSIDILKITHNLPFLGVGVVEYIVAYVYNVVVPFLVSTSHQLTCL